MLTASVEMVQLAQHCIGTYHNFLENHSQRVGLQIEHCNGWVDTRCPFLHASFLAATSSAPLELRQHFSWRQTSRARHSRAAEDFTSTTLFLVTDFTSTALAR